MRYLFSNHTNTTNTPSARPRSSRFLSSQEFKSTLITRGILILMLIAGPIASHFVSRGLAFESPVVSPAGFSISGRVRDPVGNPIAGISVSLNGAGPVSTNGNGDYAFTNLAAGNYVVTPSSANYAFSPTSQTFNNLNVDRIANFVGTQTIVSITGKVTDVNNIAMSNVSVALTKNGVAAGTALTNALGDYSFTNQVAGASYGVTPAGNFTPSSQTLANLIANASANFKGTPIIPPQCNTSSFAGATNLTSSTVPYGVTIADLNGDGRLDIVAPNFNSANISVFLSTGPGSFSAATNFAVGQNPFAVATGDFDNDGKTDLVVANSGSANVSVLLGTGTGSFGAAVPFAAGSGPAAIAVGDFNNDGKADLAVANSGSANVSVLLATTPGSFGTATNFAAGTTPHSIATGDFNGDGRLDLVVANVGSATVSILLASTTPGSFLGKTDFTTGTNPYSAVVRDVNGDGRVDLAVANNGSNSVSILLGTGTGSFSAKTDFPVGGTFPENAVFGDFNGDGKADLAVLNNGNGIAGNTNISILLGTGAGSFGGPINLSLGIGPLFIAAGDLNGDGKPDLAVAHNNNANMSVLLNNGTTCNTLTSLSISGHVADSGNNALSGVAITLSGPGARAVQTDIAGNYSLPNLVPGGNYAVTAQSPYFVLTPSRADFFNLSSSQTANFTTAPLAVPPAAPPFTDDFSSTARDATKWNLGTQTAPLTAFDPQVTTAQVNGELVITPVTQAAGLHYGGYVTANLLDMRNGKVSVEVVKAATGGADTIFGIGSDSDNFYRFMVHTPGTPVPLAPIDGDKDGEKPLDVSGPLLIFQVKVNGTLEQQSIPYDPVACRFMRFRHVPPNNSIVFETSPDSGNFTVRYEKVLTKGVDAMSAELSAGTSNPATPGQTIFDNFGLGTSTFHFGAPAYSVGEGDGSLTVTVARVGDTTTAAAISYATADGTALQGSKYTGRAGTLSFAVGQTAQDINVPIVDNASPEGNQNFLLAISNPVGAGLGGPGRSILTIIDNDTTVPTTQTLTVASSNPSSGVNVTVSPNDNNNAGNGTTQFTRVYNMNSVVSLTAPASAGGNDFQKWQKDGADFVNNTTLNVNVTMDANHTMTAVYVAPKTIQFSLSSYSYTESIASAAVTVTRSGDPSATATVNYTTSDTAGSNACNVLNTGAASSRCDYEAKLGTLKFAAGELSKTISISLVDDAYAEGNENFTVTVSNPTGAILGSPSSATVTITDNDSANGTNPISQPRYYVRAHYTDFLSREPDTSGWDFWTNQTTSCGNPDLLVCRINTSASFFISIEFQQTGYLVERTYKVAYGDAQGNSTFQSVHQLSVPVIRFNEFMTDTPQISEGVIVGQGNWQQQLESNKVAFFNDFVQRSRFVTAFPTTMTPAQFVDQLFAKAGVTPSTSDRTTAINEFSGAGDTSNVAARGRALRDVAENSTLSSNEFNRAFVLMQYFGYLRRNPNDAPDADYTGYDFWLTKLNQFGGNYINAEMVKAFIESIEYKARFGP